MNHSPLKYPASPPIDLIDNFHGTEVNDPYRWLEDPHQADVESWTTAQNKLTRDFIESEVQDQAQAELKSLWNYPRKSVPHTFGEDLYYWKNTGLQAQSALYHSLKDGTNERLLLDPNTLSDEGTLAVSTTYFDPEGKYLVYSLSEAGSDWQDLKILDLKTGENLSETLVHTRFASVVWIPEKNGFYYTRFADAGAEECPEDTLHHKIYWHSLNTAQSEDRFIYEHTQEADLNLRIQRSAKGQYVLIYMHEGTNRKNRVYYFHQANEKVVPLITEAHAYFSYIGSEGPNIFFQTDAQAERCRIIEIDLEHPDPSEWKDLIPESEDVLESAKWLNGQFVCTYVHNAHHRLHVFSREGEAIQEVELPAIGTVSQILGETDDSECYFGFTSYLFPTRIYHYDLKSHRLSLHHDSELDFDVDAFETRQFFCTSKDGTKVPFFMVSAKNIKPDGSHPTVMYGYGGFRNSLTPSFNPGWLPWIKQGGILCVVNTRGGSEYGSKWYEAGTLERKQNVFDDFMAASEWVIDKKYTSAKKLAIKGGSNGGLLVATCMLQRPDLIGAVLCHVPVIDMLRYHKFTIGRYWISDYGNAEANPEDFKYMYAYSPLHNVKRDQKYPPTLVLTGDHDDRVVPAHAKKFVATLQANNHPLALLRVDYSAGHGHGKPTAKVIQEWADVYAFLFKVFELEWQTD